MGPSSIPVRLLLAEGLAFARMLCKRIRSLPSRPLITAATEPPQGLSVRPISRAGAVLSGTNIRLRRAAGKPKDRRTEVFQPSSPQLKGLETGCQAAPTNKLEHLTLLRSTPTTLPLDRAACAISRVEAPVPQPRSKLVSPGAIWRTEQLIANRRKARPCFAS